MEDSNKNEYKSRTPNSNKDVSENGDTDELGNSQHLVNFMSGKIVDHEDQVMMTKESYKSTSIAVNESTNIYNHTSHLFL